ncbi:MAG: galactose-1-phosphate uridylyltransferase, partial [Bryobacteraceae bacterium]
FAQDGAPFHPEEDLFQTTGSRGACDVVLYSPEHTQWPSQLTVDQWHKVIDLWTQRFDTLAAYPDVQYVMVFENTGEAIGVTMPHPHGQIYAFPFLPPVVETELQSAREHFEKEKACLYCALLQREITDKVRVVAENESFVAFVPFAARFPNEIQIYSRRHFGSLPHMQDKESYYLAQMISVIRKKYDNLYGFLLPLMMVVRQAPAKGSHSYFHFHIEFLPLQRSATKLKYLAAVETAAGTYLADTRAEERAEQLRRTEPLR